MKTKIVTKKYTTIFKPNFKSIIIILKKKTGYRPLAIMLICFTLTVTKLLVYI